MLFKLNVVKSFLQLPYLLQQRGKMLWKTVTKVSTKMLSLYRFPCNVLHWKNRKAQSGLHRRGITIFCMLLKVREVTNMYIKIDSFMIRRLVGEAELMDPWFVSHKVKFVTGLVPKILNLLTRRSLYLKLLHCGAMRFQRMIV